MTPAERWDHVRIRRAFAALLSAILLLLAPSAGAHTADTSYARVRLKEDRVEFRFTFDIHTLLKVVPDLDSNRDQALSRAELKAGTPAIQKFLRAHVGVEVNAAATELGTASDPFWPLDAPDPLPSSVWHTNEALVSFPFDLTPAAPLKDVALIFDVFSVLGDAHTVLGIFEYRGGLTQVVFTLAEPDYLFDVTYAAPEAKPSVDLPPAALQDTPPAPQYSGRRSNAADSPARDYFLKGIEHILTGYDHFCFLLALLVVSRLRPLVAIVTSFTIAHSITLLLGAFELVRLPSRLIECAIALSIVYVAVENLWRRNYAHRWKLTFAFGLIHGFGFANTLDPQELPAAARALSLLMFNVGVEAGQLAVVLVLLPLGLALSRSRHERRAKTFVSLAVALLGALWFIDRAFAIGFMPF